MYIYIYRIGNMFISEAPFAIDSGSSSKARPLEPRVAVPINVPDTPLEYGEDSQPLTECFFRKMCAYSPLTSLLPRTADNFGITWFLGDLPEYAGAINSGRVLKRGDGALATRLDGTQQTQQQVYTPSRPSSSQHLSKQCKFDTDNVNVIVVPENDDDSVVGSAVDSPPQLERDTKRSRHS